MTHPVSNLQEELQIVLRRFIKNFDTENILSESDKDWLASRLAIFVSRSLYQYIAGQAKYGTDFRTETDHGREALAELVDIHWYLCGLIWQNENNQTERK